MQKRRKGRKLSRKADQRKALLRTMATSLILREKIKTTEAKAKELAGFVDGLLSRAKTDNLQTKRILLKSLSPFTVKKLITEIAPRYKERKGGYTRIIKLGARKSDSGKIAIIEFIK
jgi:large subunit ribosomal protein L17